MAFDAKPSSCIASWSEDGTDVTFPIASISELTAGEADATTGDWRKILFALLEHFYTYYTTLPSGDQPGRVTITRSTTVDSNDVMTRTYTFRITSDILTKEVADEA
jgi:hypothetical protein